MFTMLKRRDSGTPEYGHSSGAAITRGARPSMPSGTIEADDADADHEFSGTEPQMPQLSVGVGRLSCHRLSPSHLPRH